MGAETDVWGEFQRLTAAGARPLVPPVNFDWGFGPRGTLAYLADPDGVVIELVDLARMFWLSPRWLDRLVVRPARFLSQVPLTSRNASIASAPALAWRDSPSR